MHTDTAHRWQHYSQEFYYFKNEIEKEMIALALHTGSAHKKQHCVISSKEFLSIRNKIEKEIIAYI